MTAVTPAITEVIPSIAHEISQTPVNYAGHAVPAPPQVVQLVNASFQFAQGAVTVVHQSPPVIHQDLHAAPHHPQMLCPIMTPMQGHFQAAFQQTAPPPYHHAINYDQAHVAKPGRRMKNPNRKRDATYRSNRHPPTVADFLREAESKKMMKSELELHAVKQEPTVVNCEQSTQVETDAIT